LWLAATALLAAACAPEESPPADDGQTESPAEEQTAAECADAHAADFVAEGTLTVGTGNPAFPPWWEGGTTDEHPEWEFDDPYLGQGYEGAFVFALAERLGFSEDEIAFVQIGFNKSIAPGPKDYDFNLQQVSYSDERAEAVGFSDSYYDVNQALVSVKGSPIAGATSLSDLADAKLGAPIGTTSLAYIEDVIQPSEEAAVYDDLNGAIRDLQNGQIDGIVVDFPTGYFIGNVQIEDGVLVGQFPTVGEQEYFALTFEPGSPLVECVNLGIAELREDGTLDDIRAEWLEQGAAAPVLE
jgi:polar amino acid transport system substrate-binding protein